MRRHRLVWRLGLWLVGVTIGMATAGRTAEPGSATEPPQVPLCMIGDSITWAELGDWWRADLLERVPTLAFVGTHTAALGYSHAGEGGNGTGQVLRRLPDIPDSPYYHLLIGTNNNSVKDPARVEPQAEDTANQIVAIVQGLLAKPSCRKVFLASVLPCFTDNPLRDQTNAATNRHLKPKLAGLPADKLVYVDYETVIRATPNWEPMIRLHPTKDGYQLLARVLADAIVNNLGLKQPVGKPMAMPGAGVRVVNLWQGGADGQTCQPIIAGWYTLSFDLTAVTGTAPKLTVVGRGEKLAQPLNKELSVPVDRVGQRVTLPLFTGYEGYGYTRSLLALQPDGCRIERILLEKMRPSGKASVYGEGSYVDTTTPPSPGELLELPQ